MMESVISRRRGKGHAFGSHQLVSQCTLLGNLKDGPQQGSSRTSAPKWDDIQEDPRDPRSHTLTLEAFNGLAANDFTIGFVVEEGLLLLRALATLDQCVEKHVFWRFAV